MSFFSGWCSGIEKGYEDWEDEDYEDPTHIEEKGLGDDEEFDFNVIPKLIEEEVVEEEQEGGSSEEDEDLYIYPEDYLPPSSKRAKTSKDDTHQVACWNLLKPLALHLFINYPSD